MMIINHKIISKLDINFEKIYESVENSILNKNNANLPAKLSLKVENDGFLNIMPSVLSDINISGLKVVSRYPSRVPTLDSDILLYDLNTGELKALIDGNFITAIRTGTVAVHSIKVLANEDFEIVAFIGLGIQAKATMKMLSIVFPNKKMRIRLYKYKNQHIEFNNFISTLNTAINYTIEYCDTYDQIIDESDVIISAVTYFDSDICDSSIFKDGCLLVPIHTRGFMNCDLTFDKVFVDDTEHVRGFKNFDIFKHKMAEVSDILNGYSEGRSFNKEKIIAYNIGIAIHDLAIADEIYKLAYKTKVVEEALYTKPESNDWFDECL